MSLYKWGLWGGFGHPTKFGAQVGALLEHGFLFMHSYLAVGTQVDALLELLLGIVDSGGATGYAIPCNSCVRASIYTYLLHT